MGTDAKAGLTFWKSDKKNTVKKLWTENTIDWSDIFGGEYDVWKNVAKRSAVARSELAEFYALRLQSYKTTSGP